MDRLLLRRLLHKKNICSRLLSSSELSTWSPLAIAFNTRSVKKMQFMMRKDDSGLFNVPELQVAEGFYALKERCAVMADSLLKEAVSPNRKRKMVEIFDDLSDTLCRVADLAEFVRIAHPQDNFSRSAEDACVSISGLVEKLNTNLELYNALKEAVSNGDKVKTDEIDDHVSKLFLFDFEQCGIHLPESERRKVVSLNDSILQVGQHFMANSGAPRKLKKDILPKEIQNFFPVDGNDSLVSGLYAESPNPIVREVAYKIYLHADKHQDYLLNELLRNRYELAVTCGFSTYGHRTLRGSALDSPESVLKFLNILSDGIRPAAEEDFKRMESLKYKELNTVRSLEIWDVPYYNQKAKREWFKVLPSDYSPYFSLGACMEGLNTLLKCLFDINLVSVEPKTGEVWDNDVHKLAVVHQTEGLLGHIYCDFYEREGKPNQECHFTILGGRNTADGTYQLPVVVVMLNLSLPRWSSPTLLTPGMVDNLFHEMGHAMHSMLARTKYQHITGTRCSTDFAEVPSILMEYFVSDPRVLKLFARHFQTGEPMPEPMLQQLCECKHAFMAGEMQNQIFYSALDQAYHGPHPLKGTTTDVLADVQSKYYSLPYVTNTAWQLRFSHLVGYGAKYYAYLVSRALASWIWQKYFLYDPLNRENGEKYRRECLAHGGGKPPAQLVLDFLKKEPTPEMLAESLMTEVESNSRYMKRVMENLNV